MTDDLPIAFRAFCEQPGCLWSSPEVYDTDHAALAVLCWHSTRQHPNLLIRGQAEECRP